MTNKNSPYRPLAIILVGATSLTVFLHALNGINSRLPKRSISIFQYVKIGGMQQWMMAHGESTDLPVLLWIHGGPGSAQSPVARSFIHKLEEEFIVVHWDQRGAGKSNPRNFDESTMTVENYIRDVHQMTQYLKEKCGKQKIYLLGHSWGTQLGMIAVKRYPEDYCAYIGVGQVVHHHNAQRIAFEELKSRIKLRGSRKDLHRLEALQSPPYIQHADYVAFAKLLNKNQMNMDVKMNRIVKAALFSNTYSLADLRNWLRGANRGSGPMWQQSQGWDILNHAPNIEVPCYFISGEFDFNTPAFLVDEMLKQPQAPETGVHYIISGAGHTPFFGNPYKFHSVLASIKKTTENHCNTLNK
jgi:pimeloyl-ACP methyl ester carboxylesterase